MSASAEPDLSNLRPVKGQMRMGTLRTIAALMLREMSSSYGRSPGGYAWALLEPIGGIAMLTIIFSLGFRSPSLGSNFPIFYATGILPFFFYTELSAKVAQSINYSKQLLAYPRVTFVDAMIARFTLTMLTQLLVNYIIFTGILLVFDTRTTLEVPRILMAYAMIAALGLGVGSLNCFLMSMFPLWQRAWSIVNRPLLLVSGVIFIYENIPHPYADWLWYNPLMHVTGEMRAAFYLSYDGSYVSPLYVFGFSLICGVTGLMLLRRYHRDIMEL